MGQLVWSSIQKFLKTELKPFTGRDKLTDKVG